MSIDSRSDTSPGRSSVKEFALERKLGLAETVGLSLSVVGPTVAMAFNASLVARAAGRAAPLAFVGSSAHRRSGLAELVIRTSLEEATKATGLEQTSLHATNEGLPVYTGWDTGPL